MKPSAPCLTICALFWILVACYCYSLGLTKGKMRVVIDTDCGADDAMAILLLLAAGKRFHVEGITTVNGNTGVGNATRNVLLTLQAANRMDVAVYVGSEDPLLEPGEMDAYFGWDGFGDYPYPEPNHSNVKHQPAAVFLADIVHRYPGEIFIFAFGPLTNIALAAHLNPKFLSSLKGLSIMGGSYKGRGNIKPGAEFNTYIDPEAAHYVFLMTPKSQIVLTPMETGMETPFSMVWRKKVLGSLKSKSMALLNKAERKALFNKTQWVCYDQIAAASLIDPRIVTGTLQSRPIVEVGKTSTRGVMLHDFENKRVTIVTAINRRLFKAMLLKALS